MSKKPYVVLGVTGSIAAYKAAELVRLMIKSGWEVSVIMTREAKEFVGEATFSSLSQNPVTVDMFGDYENWVPGHISLADRADVLLIAPCTANVIAKMANGLADDILTCTALAACGPVVIAPAMNVRMWEHPATKANVETLKKRGVHVVSVGSGDLACGDQGHGRLAALDVIMAAVKKALGRKRSRS
jgi:phosphopantothenoylcysteine synthetase/decarboxylase